jgi:hypothetical protein
MEGSKPIITYAHEGLSLYDMNRLPIVLVSASLQDGRTLQYVLDPPLPFSFSLMMVLK